MQLTFLGGAETVTGSRFLVEAGATRVLVDCGLFQGLKSLRLRNREPFPVAPESLDAVVLTHAHIDHSGYIPVLVRDGFEGPIYSTPATQELSRILLSDSGYLQEEDARYANRHRTSRHDPALPLYTEADAHRAVGRFEAVEFDRPFTVGNVEISFARAGHILGAASVRVSDAMHTVTFSGDLGRPRDPLMHSPASLASSDYVVVESTYGNRRHSADDPADQLAGVIARTSDREGIVLIPSFAVGRAQTVLYLLHSLRREGRIPDVPVYLNSPMAIDVTRLYIRYLDEHRLSESQCREVLGDVQYVRTVDESKALTARRDPLIVISASGMASGGRVLHHLRSLLPDPRHTVVFCGYQAAGTRGEALLAGADEVKMFGEYVPVRSEITALDGLSAHADRGELLEWLGSAPRAPKATFIVHGDPSAQDALRREVRDRLDWDSVFIPAQRDLFELAPSAV